MKPKTKLIALLLVTSLLFVSGCSFGSNALAPLVDAELLPVCIDGNSAQFSVERQTSITYTDPYSATAPFAEVSESFVIHNKGNDATVRLIYPCTMYLLEECQGNNKEYFPELTIDDKEWTDWWGALSIGDTRIARREGTLISNLNNGTYFQAAFPNWPTMGEQKHQIKPSEHSTSLSEDSSVSFFVREIDIPAGAQITVNAAFTLSFLRTIRLLHLNNEIPCTSHKLTVNAAENVGYPIDAQNLLEQEPDGFPWVAELSPEQTEYYITTEGIR